MEKNSLKRSNITEKEIVEIFQEQYNDIFSEILHLEQTNFFKLLEKQVFYYLDLTERYAPQTLVKKVLKNFVKKYVEEKKKVTNDFELINNTPKEQLDYLDKLNCIIHCPKSKNALHTCRFKFVLYGNYVYCLSCKKVYNKHMIDMYCDKCDLEYYTKLREITDYNYETYYLISIKNYHCDIDTEERIKCPKCDKDLYANIFNMTNYGKIEEGTCIYCNLKYNINLFNYKCKQCGKYFVSEAKIYNDFNNKKNDLICKIHALVNNKFSCPNTLLNKTCECNLNNVVKYKHNDGGILLDGKRNGQKIILCDKCYKICDYDDYTFYCPLCNKKFNTDKSHNYKKNNLINNGEFKELRLNKRHSTFVEKNPIIKRDTCLLKERHHSSPEESKGDSSSSSSKNKKNKNVLKNQNNAHNKLKSNNQKSKNMIKSKNGSKTHKENNNKKIVGKINQTDHKNNENKNINLDNQQIDNNYTPLVHIMENSNSKIPERTNISKNLLNSNYKLIQKSRKMTKKKSNMNNNDLTNGYVLKRCITQNPRRNTTINSAVNNKKNKIKENTEIFENNNNISEITEEKLNENKEKELNANLNLNLWNDNRKKLSASFTVVSSNKNTNNTNDYQINNSPINTQSSTRETKKRYSSESDKIQNMIDKTKILIKDTFNNNKDSKKKITDKVNPIKEINEEYLNEKKEMIIKKPKSILRFDTGSSGGGSNKNTNTSKKKKKVILASSVSEEKYQKIHKPKTFLGDNNNSNYKKNNPKSKMDENLNNIFKFKTNITSTENKSNIPNESNGENIPRRRTQRVVNKKQIKTNKKNIVNEFNSDDYNILNMLGEGTFSQIFLVEHGKTHEKFALKKMAATKMEDLEKKKREFDFIIKLNSENEKLNLVKIYGTQMKVLDKFNMVLYILMEAAASDWETELKNRHYKKEYYTEEQLKHILLNLVETFAILQRKGICHRDVKPQNILCFGNGVYKITDFGEAKNKNKMFEKNTTFNYSQDTSVQTIRGTELYMSPILFNALRNSNVEDLQYNAFKSDVFSLGLCFLLAGCLSYRPISELREIKEKDRLKILVEKALNKRYSKNMVKIIYSMLQLEEKDRPDFIELENIIKKMF